MLSTPTAPAYPLQEVDVQLFALIRESFLRSDSMWHFLYFLPLPHQQGSLRPSFGISLGAVSPPNNLDKNPIRSPFYFSKTAPVSAD